MGFMDTINEQIFILFSMYYYECFFYKNKIQVRRIIQSESYNPNYIVDFKRKCAYHIIKDRMFTKGHKLILHFNIDSCIPLESIIEESVIEINSNLLKTVKTSKLVGSVTSKKKKESEPMNITESNYPPHMLFEINNGTFVTKTLSKPKETDWTFVALVIGVIIVIIALMVTGITLLKG
jgi:hypothetical protein